MFRWAAGEELIPVEVFTALAVLPGLQKGRTPARETISVKPVADAVVDATLPHVNRFVRGLIEFQRLTGCRPGEACLLRQADIDQSGPVWFYRRAEGHKKAHLGKTMTVAIGPKAQAIITPFFTADPTAFLFSPQIAVTELHDSRRVVRKTPLYASHLIRNRDRRVKNPKRAAREHYTSHSYAYAVTRACMKAFPPTDPAIRRGEDETKAEWLARLKPKQMEALKAWQAANHWHPNQLRHTFATKVREQYGLEAVQVLLGHERADVTQIYAERNTALAAAVAAKVG
jgi:integrase